MDIKPIKNERDYDRALEEIDGLMDAKPNTLAGDRLDVLVTLVLAYEEKHWRIEAPDPIDAIEFRMEQRGLTRRDLEEVLGSRSRVSEILSRKRSLTVEMMRRLYTKWGIPAESLLRPTVKSARKKRRRSKAA